ncbi:unannotated protein [freshwater metagenome]|uniref:Unannotated protein n=2 Tax=freshwater metagenome TaxID=449393 RepID=A0A6J6R2J3_9ZZZZ|nr:SDR family oxidoreductase [Actinomycetota bacterium]MSV41032.1 SDR family oxidoreductase [Actinomycetota bacterium]MSV95140.1 SDR family oxidoreductase [Actinomycetota bacterium]MSW61487.1 SDR family oxidoreductase [Actinomycetota bacterium]MSY44357.1 SDR family oxidoreductase [Actinomycetota bacterium]
MTSIAVVTGGAGSMGSACATALASDVDVVLLSDIDAQRLEVVGKEVQQTTTANIVTTVGDLGDPHFALDLATRSAELGELRALVHTAGLSPAMAGWHEILRVDLVASARLLEAFLPLVVKGSVAVCVASVSGHMGEFDPAMDAVLDEPLAADLEARFVSAAGDEPDAGNTYRLAKRGVIRMCRRAAIEWGAQGGRVISLSPGLIDTEMGRLELQHQPIKQWLAEITPVSGERSEPDTVLPGRTHHISDTVAFLCSKHAEFISGCDILVDGGLLAALEHSS